jgi:(R,R)-butanediol dehydrogenase/meso-butanediol dehydrogenase/diacetyl reductase
MMRAAVFKGVGLPLAVESLPEPKPGAGEVVLKVGRCGICGSDLHFTSGKGALQLNPGHILGHEFAGEVVEVGPECSRIKVGDRVTAMPTVGCGKCPACQQGEPKWCPLRRSMQGGYGQYLATGEASCTKLPVGLSLEDGALIEPLAVSLHGVSAATMPVGARVLVIGAGPVGLAAIFWARRMGAGKIAVTASSNRRAELAMLMGASAFVTPEPGVDPVDSVKQALGGPPDVVFECVGVPGMIQSAVSHVRPLGTVVVLGFCDVSDPWLPFSALFKEVRMVFALLYSTRDFQVAVDTLDAGHVEPRAMITDRISLDETPTQFEALRQRSTQCKVIIDPWR